VTTTTPLSCPGPQETNAEVLGRLLSELQRYAGWRAKDHASVAVRADVRALAEAMDTGSETASRLMVLDKDIERLPSGGIRKMLRRALGELRPILDSSEMDLLKGDRP
jgi:hypothetical protein